MSSRFGDHIRPNKAEDLKFINNMGFTLNRFGLPWFYLEMRGKQKYYIRICKSMPENQKWHGGLYISYAFLKKK